LVYEDEDGIFPVEEGLLGRCVCGSVVPLLENRQDKLVKYEWRRKVSMRGGSPLCKREILLTLTLQSKAR
jgi:hypothetical protein